MQLHHLRDFQAGYSRLAYELSNARSVDVGEWHAMDVKGNEALVSRELQDVILTVDVPGDVTQWQAKVEPNLPWAEDHFQERVSGEPMNPAPSHEWWPYATGSNSGNERHLHDGRFSHTYPERFWPKFAMTGQTAPNGRQIFVPHMGVRFEYGDLQDLVEIMNRNLFTRQAYLPIWFPEDLKAAEEQQRVPCTLGYHFMARPVPGPRGSEGGLLGMTCNYYIRSCDFMRYFKDDLYMAGRLLQWVANMTTWCEVLTVNMHISSLHAFEGDLPKLKEIASGHA